MGEWVTGHLLHIYVSADGALGGHIECRRGKCMGFDHETNDYIEDGCWVSSWFESVSVYEWVEWVQMKSGTSVPIVSPMSIEVRSNIEEQVEWRPMGAQ